MTWCVMVLALIGQTPQGVGEVMPVKQNDRAPFTGVLVPEGRFIELLEGERLSRELEVRLEAAEHTSAAIEAVYRRKLEGAGVVPWYDSPSLNRWLGIVLGGAVAGVAVWAVVELQAPNR